MNLSYITSYHVFETGSFQDPSIDAFSPWTGSDSYLSANPPFAYTNTSDSSFFREFKGCLLPRSMYSLWTMTTGGSLSIAVLDQVCLGRGKGEGWGVAECLAGRVPLAFLIKKHKEHFESVVRNCIVSWLKLIQLSLALRWSCRGLALAGLEFSAGIHVPPSRLRSPGSCSWSSSFAAVCLDGSHWSKRSLRHK